MTTSPSQQRPALPPRPSFLLIVLLGVSVAMNTAFVIGLVGRHNQASALASASTMSGGATAGSNTGVREPAAVEPKTWQALTAGSIPEAIARLRSEGFPPNLLRLIVTALVDAQFAQRHHEIAEMIRARPWWQPNFGGDNMKVMVARQKLQRDIQDQVDDLIGADLGDEYTQAGRRYRYGDLPPAKLALFDRINGDYGELGNEIKAEAGGILLDEDKEKLRYLAEQAHAETAAYMTPAEQFEYDLHGNPTGWWLRTQLQYMNPTDEEFRAIFKVQDAFMAPFDHGNPDLWTADTRAAMDNVVPPLKDRIKAVLSPERFAEYELTTDPAYYATAPLVERLQLPPTATADIVTVQRDITKRADAIRADATLTGDARATQLSALVDEANLRLVGTLGDSGLTAYRNGPGAWLKSLKPTPPKH